MKTIIITLVTNFLLVTTLFSWDSTAAKFYPLAIGNTWSYHHINWGMMGNSCIVFQSEYYVVKRIVSDTVMPNGKIYFKFNNGNFERIDSASMNVYRYHPSGERILDSLLARKNDYFRSYRSGIFANHQVIDTNTEFFAGTSRRGKQINGNSIVSHMYFLVYGIGLYSEKYCEFGGSTDTLYGCIINGIQYGQISAISSQKGSIPYKFTLSQNYPNPFNPKSNIKFQIAKSGYVKLVVSDALGKEVSVLVNEQLQPGTYEVEWDGTYFPSGVYFYKLIAAGYTETRKMVLVK
jgi:hypothetical protein